MRLKYVTYIQQKTQSQVKRWSTARHESRVIDLLTDREKVKHVINFYKLALFRRTLPHTMSVCCCKLILYKAEWRDGLLEANTPMMKLIKHFQVVHNL